MSMYRNDTNAASMFDDSEEEAKKIMKLLHDRFPNMTNEIAFCLGCNILAKCANDFPGIIGAAFAKPLTTLDISVITIVAPKGTNFLESAARMFEKVMTDYHNSLN